MKTVTDFHSLGFRANYDKEGGLKSCMVILPLPPSVNRYWRSDRGRGPHLTEAARVYKQEVAAICFNIVASNPLDSPVSFKIDQYRAQRRGDLDNRLKALFDAIQGCLIMNDSQVQDLHIRQHDNRKLFPQGAMVIEMTVLDQTLGALNDVVLD